MTSPPPKKQRASPTLYYQLEATTGDPIPISQEAIRHIKTLSAMISNMDITADSTAPPLPVAKVTGETLQKIVEWCEHHKDEPLKTEAELEAIGQIPSWDDQFLEEMSNEELTELIIAADFLDVGLLSVYVSEKVARSADGKSCEQIMREFGIPEN